MASQCCIIRIKLPSRPIGHGFCLFLLRHFSGCFSSFFWAPNSQVFLQCPSLRSSFWVRDTGARAAPLSSWSTPAPLLPSGCSSASFRFQLQCLLGDLPFWHYLKQFPCYFQTFIIITITIILTFIHSPKLAITFVGVYFFFKGIWSLSTWSSNWVSIY